MTAESGGWGGADTSVGDNLCVRMGSGDLSGMERGVEGAAGNSREVRLEVSTANPASCNFLTRSAIEVPSRLLGPASLLSSLMGHVSKVKRSKLIMLTLQLIFPDRSTLLRWLEHVA